VEPLRVLYAADCGFCRWSLALLLRRDRDGRLLPLPIESPEGDELLAGMPREQRLRSAHVVTPDGRVWSGGDAVEPIARALWGRVPAGAARALRPPLRGGYRLVADNRFRLGPRIPQRRRDAAAEEIARHRRRVEAARA
jgi:predicted DCC family thiol-disulfide oxidoreductase YuxK